MLIFNENIALVRATAGPLGSQNGIKSGPEGTQNEVQNEVWKLNANFSENVALARATAAFCINLS